MARIPEHELERLKQIPLQRLAEARGVELRRQGKDLVGLCVFHEERTPSLVISPQPNLFHCFGCGAAGSPIDWVMKTQNVSFRHAVEILRELDGGLPAVPANGSSRPLKKLAPVLQRCVEDEKLLLQVVDYYHRTLLETPRGLEYLKQRGLDEPELLKAFQLGFSNRTLGYRLPKGTKTVLRQRLKDLGILRSSGHEHYNGCLVVPIFDEQGRVAELYGRKINDNLRSGTAYHLYLPKREGASSSQRGIFNLPAVGACEELLLCESVLDALSFWRAGHRNVTSSFGVNGFSNALLEAFQGQGVRRVLIAFDADKAGERGARTVANKLVSAGIAPFRVQFPSGLDANDYLLQHSSGAEEAFGRLLRQARFLGQGPAPELLANSRAPVELRAEHDEGQRKREARGEVQRQSKPPQANTRPVKLAHTEPEPPPAEQAEETRPGSGSAPDAGHPQSQPSFLAAEAAAAEPANQSRGSDSSPLASCRDVLQQRGEQIEMRSGDRFWRVRGLADNPSASKLSINLLCARGQAFHVDHLDLYQSRSRHSFLRQAAAELDLPQELLKRDLGKLLLGLEELLEQGRAEPKPVKVVLNEQERAEALEFLRDPKLIDRILADFDACGVIGERSNKLLGYLAAVSRKLARPLGVLIQSSSAAGKSSLLDAILSFMPPEEQVKYSAMTGQSLYYMEKDSLKHKILAVVEEEGAQRASYALKLLQSEGELSIASTGKDSSSGRLKTHEYHIDGPVAMLSSTTAVQIDEELHNRFFILGVDEGRKQTRAIHQQQRREQTLAGMLEQRRRPAIRRLHQNAQRLLRPLLVVNPFAERLTFLDDRTRLRRDHLKYLTLIKTIALLRQHQRRIRTCTDEGETVEYIAVEAEDIELANHLAHEALGHSLDELPPQTRRLLELLEAMVAEQCEKLGIEQREYRFSRRDLREHTGYSYEQIRVHLSRLVELEYVLVHRGRRGQSFVYELLYDGGGKDGQRFVIGLLELSAQEPRQVTTQTLGGQQGDFGGPLGAQTGAKPAPCGPVVEPIGPRSHGTIEDFGKKKGENSTLDEARKDDSRVILPEEEEGPEEHRRREAS